MTTAQQPTTASQCRYSVGQAVHVEAIDFAVKGFPTVWFDATITAVELRDNGMFDVQVLAANGTWHPQIVGKRGGNSRLRSA